MTLMLQVLAMIYLWLKAGHVIFVIFWMAGLFMLPRLFVYHQETPVNSPENAVWIDRERAPRTSGVLATAGGVVFTALQDGAFVGYNDETLEELYRIQLGTPLKAAPMTYSIGPKQ